MPQDEFQRKIDEVFEWLNVIATIVDDILVYGSTRQEHDINLVNVLNRARQRGIKLNEEKLEVSVSEVQYFWHILSSAGLKPDTQKVTAVREMKAPPNRADLETFLGMVKYLAKFSQNLATITRPRFVAYWLKMLSWDKPQALIR